jgi:hypothetical protein
MPPKRKRAKADPDAWRQVIFYWRGLLVVTEGGIRWEGNWKGSDGTVPIAAEISAGEKFMCASSDTSLSALNFSTSSYELDNGDGVSKFMDEEHDIRLSPKSADTSEEFPAGISMLAVGRGANEFGAFISAGYVVDDYTLLLARRYLSNDDARRSLSFEELHKSVWARGVRMLATDDWGQVLLPLRALGKKV